MAIQAASRFIPWRSSILSGSTLPLLSFLSQLPSSVISVIDVDLDEVLVGFSATGLARDGAGPMALGG